MDNESRKALAVVGGVLVGLLAIGLIFSGSPGDAVIGDAPVAAHGEADAHGERGEAEAPAAAETAESGEATASPEIGGGEAEVAEVSELAPGAEESQAGEPETEAVAEAEAEGATAGDAAPAGEGEAEAAPEGETEIAALAGDPEAGERVFRQCQACHQVGEGAANGVGPMLSGVVGRQIASAEGFTYSDSLAAVGQEGRHWTPDELRGFLANPREYVPGTAMAYAGVRSEEDLEDVIAYLATFE